MHSPKAESKKGNVVMLKLVGVLSLILSANAFANDGGMAVLSVKGIQAERTPTHSNPMEMKFYGGEAGEFMKMLPGLAAAMPQAKEYAKHFKGLRVNSPKYSMGFFCEDAAMDMETGKFYPKQTECSVKLEPRNDDNYGDTWKFSAEKVCKEMSATDSSELDSLN